MLPRSETAVLPINIVADLFVQHLQPSCIVVVEGSAHHSVIFTWNVDNLDTIMRLSCM